MPLHEESRIGSTQSRAWQHAPSVCCPCKTQGHPCRDSLTRGSQVAWNLGRLFQETTQSARGMNNSPALTITIPADQPQQLAMAVLAVSKSEKVRTHSILARGICSPAIPLHRSPTALRCKSKSATSSRRHLDARTGGDCFAIVPDEDD